MPKFKKSLSELNIEELYEAVKQIKVQHERTRMENIWIENYLRVNAPHLLPFEDKKNPVKRRLTFARKSSRLTAINGVKLQSFRLAFAGAYQVDKAMKSELCEKETLKMERDIETLQNQHVHEMKTLFAKIEEAEIVCKEFSKCKSEFESIVVKRGVDPMTNKISSQTYINFLKDLIRKGGIMTESIRMKTLSLKSDCKKQQLMLKKKGELSSWLRPVDFEIVMIEKQKFLKLAEEKQNQLNGLRRDEHAVSKNKNLEQKLLLQATFELNQIIDKNKHCQRVVAKLKQDAESLETENEILKKSVQEIGEMGKVCKAPTVDDYINKTDELHKLKIQLKAIKRKSEAVKISLINSKKKHRQQSRIK